MLVREVITDAKTGEFTERMVEMPDVLTAEQALAQQAEADRLAHNAAITAEMDAADLRIMRALLDGDTARIEAHRLAQAERRKLLR